MTINEAKSIIEENGMYLINEQETGSFDDFIAKLNDLWADEYSDDENYQSIDEMMQDEWYSKLIQSYFDDNLTPTEAVDKLFDDISAEANTIENENDYINDDSAEDDFSDYPEDDRLGTLNGFEDPYEKPVRTPDDFTDDTSDLYDEFASETFPSAEEIEEAMQVLNNHGYMLTEANEFRGMDNAALGRFTAFKNCFASAKTHKRFDVDVGTTVKFIKGFASFIQDAPERGKAKIRELIDWLNTKLEALGQEKITVGANGEIDGEIPPQPTGAGGDNPNRRGAHAAAARPAQEAPARPAEEAPAEEAPAQPAHEAPAEVNVKVNVRTIIVKIDTEGGEEADNIRAAYDSFADAIKEYDPEGNKIVTSHNVLDGYAGIIITFICNPENLNDDLSTWIKQQVEDKFDNVFTFVDVVPQEPAEREITVRKGHGLLDQNKPGPLPPQYQELFADIPAAGEEAPAEEAPARPAERPVEPAARPAERNRNPRRIEGPVRRVVRNKEWRIYYHPMDEDGKVNPAITDNVVVTAPTKEAAIALLDNPADPDNQIVYDYKPGEFNERRPNEGGSFIEIWEEI
jgi:hypothetical protein